MRYDLPVGLEYHSVESLGCTITQAEWSPLLHFALFICGFDHTAWKNRRPSECCFSFWINTSMLSPWTGLHTILNAEMERIKNYLSCIILSGKITSQTATDSGVQDLLKQNGLTLICPLQSLLQSRLKVTKDKLYPQSKIMKVLFVNYIILSLHASLLLFCKNVVLLH